MKIQYLKGDATKPQVNNGTKSYICHINNDVHGWGSGFVLAINKTFGTFPREQFQEWAKTGHYMKKIEGGGVSVPYVLGQIQIVPVTDSISIVNMVAQRDVRGLYEEGVQLPIPNVKYSSLHECLLRLKIRVFKSNEKIELHMPMIGSGLGGGNWQSIEKIINLVFEDTNIPVYVYQFEEAGKK